MNLLAHALLTPPSCDPGLLVGNLVADWVKGRARRALPPPMQIGMALHQRIDAFTDSHPLPATCAELLAPAWGRYAPVLVDIFFDHVLSLDWDRCCPRPRRAFIADACDALRRHVHLLPPRAQYAVYYLLADDWLSAYATLDGIALSLSRLSVRLNERGHDIQLAPAIADFRRHQPRFHEVFHEFFPLLARHVEAPRLATACSLLPDST